MKQPFRMIARILLSLCWLPVLADTQAYAESRALIITIGLAYRHHAIPSIQGPDRDADLAIAVARKMGFRDTQIKVLREEQATKMAILAGLQWLRQGVQAGEQAFFYYSGHGTQLQDTNGDEDDGCDEALVPVDAGTGNMLRDDELALHLQELRQRARTVVVIDACFSGTITRTTNAYAHNIIKYYQREGHCGRPINIRSLMVTEAPAVDSVPPGNDQLLVFTAAAQNEVAFGDVTRSGRGSLFTQAIHDIIMGNPASLSFEEVRKQAAARIRQASLSNNLIAHTPQLEGTPGLLRQSFQGNSSSLPSPTDGGRVPMTDNAMFFEELILRSQFQVAIQASNRKFQVGQRISFTFRSSKEGYLNLIELQPDGEIQVLFPNNFVPRNHIKPYEDKRIPDDIGGFRYEAQEPFGISRIIALVTDKPLNFYQRQGGKLVGDFKILAMPEAYALRQELSRSLVIEPEKGTAAMHEFGATDIVLEVVK